MLSTPHAHLELVKQQAMVAQLRTAAGALQQHLRVEEASTAHLRGELADLASQHRALVTSSTAALDKAQNELGSRPSAKEWTAARSRLAACEAELEAAAEAGFDRAVLQVRAQQSQREAAHLNKLQRPGALATQDKTAHALHGLAPRLRAMPQNAAHALLLEVCSELQLQSPDSAPGAVRTLKTAVASLPVLDAVITQVAALGVTARVVTASSEAPLADLASVLGAPQAAFTKGIAAAARGACQPANALPSTVGAAVRFIQSAVHHVMLLPPLCLLLRTLTGVLLQRNAAAAPDALVGAYQDCLRSSLQHVAASAPPVIASEPLMASWFAEQLGAPRSSTQARSAATALQGALHQLLSAELELKDRHLAFADADGARDTVGAQVAEREVVAYVQQALRVDSVSGCIPALAAFLNQAAAARQ
jgi:hypothetical protein